LENHIKAEKLLEKPPPVCLDSTDDSLGLNEFYQDELELFSAFTDDLCTLCSDTSKSLRPEPDDLYPHTRFTVLFRLLLWCSDRNGPFLDSQFSQIWELFLAISKPPWRGLCNAYECLSLLVSLTRPADFNAADFADSVLPIDFDQEPLLNLSLFLLILRFASGIITDMSKIDSFCQTFRSFLEFLSTTSEYFDTLKNLADLVGTNRRLAAELVSLIALFDGSGLPVSFIPIIVSATQSLEERFFVPVFQTGMVLVDLAATEIPTIRRILDRWGAPLLDLLGSGFDLIPETIEMTRVSTASLCQLFQLQMSVLYRSALGDFLVAGGMRDGGIRDMIVTFMTEGHAEIARDSSVCWDCLELRLRLYDFVSDKADFLEKILRDAVVSSEVYEPTSGSTFLKVLVLTLEASGIARHEELIAELIRGIEQSGVFKACDVESIENAIERSGNVFGGLRLAADILGSKLV
jgi:hypothetical protein